ncbi:hypothetical protein ACJMK2_028251 [Sinanodonta woodiana]|uniref:BTB domain-containing protein n=1 Tax=Sinanodonta woodiana TaxID=1069815 RepID=A0ABD3X6I4_SINWO
MSSSEDIQSETSESDENVNDDPDLKEFDFTIKSAWSDLELEVEGKTLYVTRGFLDMISPVFRRMFKSEFKEKEAKSISLPDKKYEDVLTFLRCTIPWASVKVTSKNNHFRNCPLAHINCPISTHIHECLSLYSDFCTAKPEIPYQIHCYP